MINIVSYGAGTNSTAMLVELVNLGIKIDLILFADTGGEKPHTYEYIDMFSLWLVDHGMPEIVTVKKVRKDGSIMTLEEDCIEKNMLPSIAYGFKSCSQKYKIQPQDKFINNWAPAKAVWKKGERIIKYIGYDADEPHRAKDYGDKKYALKYPLIEWGWGRDECIDAIKEAGLNLPGKSSCYFCPSSKKNEIIQLSRMYPELARRAIELEDNAELTSIKGLGRYFSWADLMKANEDQIDAFPESYIEIDCGCYDGQKDN